MANAYILNQVPTGYGQAMSLLAEMLVAAGWSYKASGDGLAGYNATGKVFTGTSSGALGWNNNRAWARLQGPAATREIVIQHNAAGGLRLKYSASAKFIGGTPSATVTPSATDERVLRGAGTDATPTLSAFWSTSTPSGLVKYQGAAMGTAPYGFWMASALAPAGALQTGLMMDPVSGVPEDPDPVVWHVATLNAFYIAFASQGAVSTTSYPAPGGVVEGSFAHMDPLATQFLCVHASGYTAGWAFGPSVGSSWNYTWGNAGVNLNPFNGKHDTLPFLYARAAIPSLTQLGIKGWSTLARWTTVTRINFADTINSKQWICVGMVWLPWDGLTVPTY